MPPARNLILHRSFAQPASFDAWTITALLRSMAIADQALRTSSGKVAQAFFVDPLILLIRLDGEN
jgi:hypothetical protein